MGAVRVQLGWDFSRAGFPLRGARGGVHRARGAFRQARRRDLWIWQGVFLPDLGLVAAVLCGLALSALRRNGKRGRRNESQSCCQWYEEIKLLHYRYTEK